MQEVCLVPLAMRWHAKRAKIHASGAFEPCDRPLDEGKKEARRTPEGARLADAESRVEELVEHHRQDTAFVNLSGSAMSKIIVAGSDETPPFGTR